MYYTTTKLEIKLLLSRIILPIAVKPLNSDSSTKYGLPDKSRYINLTSSICTYVN